MSTMPPLFSAGRPPSPKRPKLERSESPSKAATTSSPIETTGGDELTLRGTKRGRPTSTSSTSSGFSTDPELDNADRGFLQKLHDLSKERPDLLEDYKGIRSKAKRNIRGKREDIDDQQNKIEEMGASFEEAAEELERHAQEADTAKAQAAAAQAQVGHLQQQVHNTAIDADHLRQANAALRQNIHAAPRRASAHSPLRTEFLRARHEQSSSQGSPPPASGS